MKQLSVVGAGWAGLSAAVAATQVGWQVRLFEATTLAGGRARRLLQDFAGFPLDNGQHVLIGAYRDTLALMRTVGLKPEQLLKRVPLDLRYSQGDGLCLPNWPAPFNLLAGLVRAKGWTLKDKASLTHATYQWQRHQFECNPTWTVAQLCNASHLSPRVMSQLIEPLCLSALNTAVHAASASVFLRVLHDALLDGPGSSDLLIPRVDLGALLPDACLAWLRQHGVDIQLGTRVSADQVQAMHTAASENQVVVLACPSSEAARLSANICPTWSTLCASLPHTVIATVYLHCTDANFQSLARPMVALQSHAEAPAQFVFDKGLLSQQPGLLAAVVSDCTTERDTLSLQVLAQVREQLNLQHLAWVQTVVEKRATLACIPNLNRPKPFVAPGLWACGDYVFGPYPSTLEGAVRSGQQVVAQLGQVTHR